MFGYIRTARPELRVREYDYYRASYCGLCRTMGKCTGQCSRLTLSYDFAFLLNVRLALTATVPTFCRRRCMVHPFRRRRMMEQNPQTEYAARASAILAYEKCRDDVRDERGFQRIKARLRCFFLHGAYRRAKKELPELASAVAGHLDRLHALEGQKNPTVDTLAAVFGDLLSDIVAFGLEGSAERLARTIGRQTGRFIYITDALDDLEKDQKKRRFNPFLLLYGGPIPLQEREELYNVLIAYLADMEKAFDLMGDTADPDRSGVLKNILYLGMPAALRRVLYRCKQCHKED